MESGLGGLPIELKENILLYLPNVLDRYNLALAYTEFNVVYLQSNIFRSVDLSFEFRLDDEILLKLFNWLPQPLHVTHLNLNGLYWIDAEIIKYAAVKFTNLESLFIVDTKVDDIQINMESISRLMKLHAIAINTSAALENDPFSKSFVVVRGDNRQHCIKFVDKKYALHGNITHIVMRPTSFELRHKLGFVLNGMNWINRACNSSSFKDFFDRQLQYYTKNRIDIILDIRYQPEVISPKIDKKTELVIINPQKRVLDLSPKMITCFKNLRKLTLYNTYGHAYLEEVFKECKMLVSLNIDTSDRTFALSYLQDATSLEEISLNQLGKFDFYKTFSVMAPYQKLKLKRIYISCEEFVISSYENFEKFLGEISELTFFHVDCDSSNFAKTRIESTMENSKKHPSQHFGMNKAPNWCDVSRIPLTHISMLWYECFDRFE